jgi:anti-anti-sigma regulatory factor
MLRITVGHDQDSLTLKLEGRLAGVWVKELKQCWELLPPSSRRPVVCFDLSGLTFVDAAGKAFLAAMHAQGAQFVAASYMTKAIVNELSEAHSTGRSEPK